MPRLRHTMKTPFKYQLDAVKFAVEAPQRIGVPHVYFAHSPGTGKTKTTVEFLKAINAKSALIVHPAKMRADRAWETELVDEGFCNENQIGTIQGQMLTDEWKRPFVTVSWQTALRPIPLAWLRERKFEVVIFDEARAFKALTSHTSIKFLKTTHGKPLAASGHWKLCLDGTPMPNRVIELFPPARVFAGHLLGKYRQYHLFGQHFCSPEFPKLDKNGVEVPEDYSGSSNVEELAKILKPWMHQLLLRDVKELPPIVFEDTYIDIGTMEENETNTPLPALRRLIGIKKVPFAIEFIKNSIANDPRRVVVYTHHRDVNQLICEGVDGIQLIGGMTDRERNYALHQFKTNADNKPLVMTSAGGDAVNGLQHVSSSIIKVEMDWSAGFNNQIVGRIERADQEHSMLVERLIAVDTKDQAVLGTHRKKNRDIDKLFSKRGTTNMLEKFGEAIERGISALERIAVAMEASLVTDGGDEKPKGKTSTATDKAAADKSSSKPAEVPLEDVKGLMAELATSWGDEDKAADYLVNVLETQFKVPSTSKLTKAKLQDFAAVVQKAIDDGPPKRAAREI